GIRDDLVTGVQTCALPISILSRLPVADAGAPQFVGSGSFGVDGFSAGNKLRRSLQHVNYVRIFCMYLRLARFFAAAGMDHIVATIAAIQQDRTLREGFVHLALLKVGNWGS